MDVHSNPHQVKRLLRVLDALNGFELVIFGFGSLSIALEIQAVIKNNCRVKKIEVIDFDVSGLEHIGEFEAMLREKADKGKEYRVFNILGMQRHVKIGQASLFLNQLNLLRDRLANDFPYGLFFWLPESLVHRFALDAPDLWAWRNTVLVFEDEEKSMDPESIPFQRLEKEHYEEFNLKEKQSQINYLHDAVKTLMNKSRTLKRDKKLAGFYSDLGRLYHSLGNFSTSLENYQKTLEIQGTLGDQTGIASTYNDVGMLYQKFGKPEEALQYYKKSLEISQALGNKAIVATAYRYMGRTYLSLTNFNYREALAIFEQSLKIFREIGDRLNESSIIGDISQLYYLNGDYATAKKYLEEDLSMWQGTGEQNVQGQILSNLGTIAMGERKFEEAKQYFQEALKIKKESNNRYSQAPTIHQLGNVAFEERNWEDAKLHYREALKIFQEFNDRNSQANTYGQLGIVALAETNYASSLAYFVMSLEIFSEYNAENYIKIIIYNLSRLLSQPGWDAAGAIEALETGEETKKVLRLILEEIKRRATDEH